MATVFQAQSGEHKILKSCTFSKLDNHHKIYIFSNYGFIQN